MSLDSTRPGGKPVTTVADLATYFERAGSPRSEHRVGLEHEKLVYPVGSANPVPYDGPAGMGMLFSRLEALGHRPFRDAPSAPPVALIKGESTLSLEPGGQLELSGRPSPTARSAHEENLAHLAEVKPVARDLGLRLVALGYRPFGTVAEMPWMPKRRYQAMGESLPRRGALARHMMLMTATSQVSLDWEDEADCARKVCASARLAPLLVALYANSPLCEGKPSGLMSFRSRVWGDVDPARCGFLPSMIDGTFSFAKYIEWALDAPLLFLRRGEEYLTPSMTFRELLSRGHLGEPAYETDWTDHLSTLFPEVRIKKVLEIRSADCGSAATTGALAALFRGLLYDSQALENAERLLPRLSFEQHLELHRAAQKEALSARWGKAFLGELAGELVAMAKDGLSRLDPADAFLLEPLFEAAEERRCPAQGVLESWERVHNSPALLDAFEL